MSNDRTCVYVKHHHERGIRNHSYAPLHCRHFWTQLCDSCTRKHLEPQCDYSADFPAPWFREKTGECFDKVLWLHGHVVCSGPTLTESSGGWGNPASLSAPTVVKMKWGDKSHRGKNCKNRPRRGSMPPDIWPIAYKWPRYIPLGISNSLCVKGERSPCLLSAR